MLPKVLGDRLNDGQYLSLAAMTFCGLLSLWFLLVTNPAVTGWLSDRSGVSSWVKRQVDFYVKYSRTCLCLFALLTAVSAVALLLTSLVV